MFNFEWSKKSNHTKYKSHQTKTHNFAWLMWCQIISLYSISYIFLLYAIYTLLLTYWDKYPTFLCPLCSTIICELWYMYTLPWHLSSRIQSAINSPPSWSSVSWRMYASPVLNLLLMIHIFSSTSYNPTYSPAWYMYSLKLSPLHITSGWHQWQLMWT